MTADGGERVGPPMPGRHEQQDRNKDRVRREEERNFAVRETKRPRDLGGKIVARAAEQNPERGAKKGLGSFLALHASPLLTTHSSVFTSSKAGEMPSPLRHFRGL